VGSSPSAFTERKYASLAQRLEHRRYIPSVIGSNPVRSTMLTHMSLSRQQLSFRGNLSVKNGMEVSKSKIKTSHKKIKVRLADAFGLNGICV
jgi:hypothetical protein